MRPTAVIIARFQTPFLHEGHLYMIRTIRERHMRVVVVLGIAPVKCTRRNPFDFYTRERMLKQADPALIVLPLADHPSDAEWSVRLDRLLQTTFPSESFLLYGGRDSFLPFYSGHLPVAELPAQGKESATEVRENGADQVLSTQDFRMGVNYACQNTYPKVYATVDVALFRKDRSELLLGKKEGREGWRFPGGFSDPDDESFEDAARRELHEECGPLQTGPLHYIGSRRIDDWRYRRETDKILTLFYATDLLSGEARAADDLEQLRWFPVSALESLLLNGELTPEHQPLLRLLLDKLSQLPAPAANLDHQLTPKIDRI